MCRPSPAHRRQWGTWISRQDRGQGTLCRTAAKVHATQDRSKGVFNAGPHAAHERSQVQQRTETKAHAVYTECNAGPLLEYMQHRTLPDLPGAGPHLGTWRSTRQRNVSLGALGRRRRTSTASRLRRHDLELATCNREQQTIIVNVWLLIDPSTVNKHTQ